MKGLSFLTASIALVLATHAQAATPPAPQHYSNAAWTQPQKPFRIYGNTYYVGSHGLSAILVTSPRGHILLDGTLPENVPMIEANIRALGFRLEDVKLILNSHPHFDHAGGIAALAHDTGAQVVASAKAAKALKLGGEDPDDPQYGDASPYAKVEHVRIADGGETIKLGPLALTMHPTPGHTPGGTAWTWTSCEQTRCLSMAYVDSIALLTANNGHYRYTDPAHPERIADFRGTIDTLAKLPCDIMIAPHPDSINLIEKATQHGGNNPDALIDPNACKAYAAKAQVNLDERIAKENAKSKSPAR
ncbi:subclass B3 metallo-beta-lactamase [Dyella sp.]|uniref:subclass B3 metallo-beta-lactamase n=1 Tax=Dyella sp. TaxID=1869338 RepID=UPI002ED34467